MAQLNQTAYAGAVGKFGFVRRGEDPHLHALRHGEQGRISEPGAKVNGFRQRAAVPARHGGGGEAARGLLAELLGGVVRQLGPNGGQVRAEGKLAVFVVVHRYFGNQLRQKSTGIELTFVAEFSGTLYGKFHESARERAVRFAVVPGGGEVLGRIANGHQEGAQILRQGSQQHLRPHGEVGVDTPFRQVIREIRQLFNVHTQGNAVVRLSGVMAIVDGVLLPRVRKGVRVKVLRCFVLAGVDAFRARNKQNARVLFFCRCSPLTQGLLGGDGGGQDGIKE